MVKLYQQLDLQSYRELQNYLKQHASHLSHYVIMTLIQTRNGLRIKIENTGHGNEDHINQYFTIIDDFVNELT